MKMMQINFRAVVMAALLFAGLSIAPNHLLMAQPAVASPELQSVVERLNRLDRDMTTLRRQTFRGEGGGAGGAGSVDNASQINDSLSGRVSDLESALQNLTGQLEQQVFQVRQENTQLKERIGDLEARLRKIEDAQASHNQATQANAAQASQAAPAVPHAGDSRAAVTTPTTPAPAQAAAVEKSAEPATVAGQLGNLKTDAKGRTKASFEPKVISGATPPAGASIPDTDQTLANAGANAARPAANNAAAGAAKDAKIVDTKAATAAAPANATNATPREQYNRAFSYLQQRNYAEAEKTFKSFVTANPTDSLTGNALFWLGETYSAQKNYPDAASQYLDSYRKFPKGSKAVESLLKLGVSLQSMGEKQQACQTFARVLKEHPDAPSSLKQRAESEKKQAGCP
jgi:tol-pal system protein YbgF